MSDEPIGDAAARRGLALGAFGVDAHDLRTDYRYRETLRREFTTITPGNALKMGPLRPSPHTFDFADADAVVSFGREHDMRVRGHTLAWHEAVPDWFQPWEYSDEQVGGLLRDHVRTVVGRYRGRIDAWDVVNEAVADDGTRRRTAWHDALGEAYVDRAFEWAHEADPDAALYYNDYGAEAPGAKADGVYDLVAGLVDRDVPIDGVGLQLHALGDWPDPADVAATIERFHDLGLAVQITEMDVAFPRGAVPDDPLAAQAEYYRDVVEVCLETGVDALLTCGVHDEGSWLRFVGDFPERFTGDPLLFDDWFQPKPAYHAVQEALATDD
jgi:endo-1,4-beta-xylanase